MMMMTMIQDDWRESDVFLMVSYIDLSECESSKRLIIFLGICCHISAAMKQRAVEHHMFVYNAYVQRQGNVTFCIRYPMAPRSLELRFFLMGVPEITNIYSQESYSLDE